MPAWDHEVMYDLGVDPKDVTIEIAGVRIGAPADGQYFEMRAGRRFVMHDWGFRVGRAGRTVCLACGALPRRDTRGRVLFDDWTAVACAGQP
jgi:hypothetical protein